jgi:SNF2 family DNA or RNA helicase
MFRRWANLRRDTRRIEARFEEARSLIGEARTVAISARDQFEYERGLGALPRIDSPDETDQQLAVALDTLHTTYQVIDLPLRSAISAWERESAARDSFRSRRLLLKSLFSHDAKAALLQDVALVERCVIATRRILDRDLDDRVLSLIAHRIRTPSKEHVDQALADYAANNAAAVAVLDRLNIVGTTPEGKRRPGVHGGLPEEIADAVERTTLDPGPLKAILRRYQEFGARYIIRQKRVLLGDDMGLGKTVQVLAAMCHLHSGGPRHFLVVAPNSVMVNWEREVRKHTGLSPVVLHGSHRETLAEQWNLAGGVAITTYATLGKIIDLIERVDMVAVDEAHLAKNPSALRTQAVESLTRSCEYVTLMTGTSLENRLDEMKHLVLLAQPDLAESLATVTNGPSGVTDPNEMYGTLAPVYLRRTQDDVLTELPECIVTDEWIDLTPVDRDTYTNGPIDVMTRRLLATVGDGTRTSAKYERLLELTEEHLSEGRKIVIFSYFRQVIDDVCALLGDAPQITGSTNGTQRQRLIDEFSSRPDCPVLVSQVDAGGLGVNLQAAQVVILMEAQFKPSTEWQAIARVHRMGQSRAVLVHRLLARKTIEERLVELIEMKAHLFETYADKSSIRDVSAMAVNPAAGISIEELTAFLETE